MAINRLTKDQPDSEEWASQCRLTRAIARLWPRAVGQSHLGEVSQIRGYNISVGVRIFNIAISSGSVGGLCRGFELRLLGGRDLHWLHTRKMLEEA